MFLSCRATQAEYFDAPNRSLAEVREGYRLLARVNRVFRFAEPFQRLLPQLLGESRCRSLTLLDLGAGDGSLGTELTVWALQRGWHWQVTNLDLNPQALQSNGSARNVVGSAHCLPFQTSSFDVVVASQMTHHLGTDADVARHFSDASRVSRDAVLLYDLHRGLPMYVMIWLFLHVFGFPAHFRSDGLLSVRRGWRVREWVDLAARAGLKDARVWQERASGSACHGAWPAITRAESPHAACSPL